MKKTCPIEKIEQNNFIKWCKKNKIFVYHVNNGVKSNRGMQFKQSGVVPGIPDLQLVLKDGKVLWIEMKRQFGSSTSQKQKAVHEQLRALGHDVFICKGCNDAILTTMRYLGNDE